MRLFGRHTSRYHAARKIEGVTFAGRLIPWADLCRHMLFMGGTGSGKTVASNGVIRQCMRAGNPMLCTCVKEDDYARLFALAEAEGQAHRVVEITPGSRWTMNLMESLLSGGSVDMAVQLLSRIGEVNRHGGGGGGQVNEAFWVTQGERAIKSAIVMCQRMLGRATIPDVHAVIMSSPTAAGAYLSDPQFNPAFERDAQGNPIRRGLCAELWVRALKSGLKDRAFDNAANYLLIELPGGGDRMRGGVIANANNVLGYFIDEPWVQALSGDTTMHPKLIDQHRLIGILNYPVAMYQMPARLWQFAWTMEAQRWCMSRDASRIELPFILVRDEVGWTLNPGWDALFCLVARSQKLAHIDIVQDVSTLLMGLGGAEAEAYSFLANHLAAKALFGSEDMRTNQWMSALLGQHREIMLSGHSGGHQPTGDWADDLLGVGNHAHWSEQWRPVCPPEKFARLPVAQAVVVMGGKHQFVDFWEGKR